ncbi:MAG: hypothetical protein ACREFE_17140 [Limisphaerales bacterium]
MKTIILSSGQKAAARVTKNAQIRRQLFLFAAFLFGLNPPSIALAGVPPLLNFQGRIVIGGTSYNGAGQFKFALVDSAGTNTYWSNDGTNVGDEPTGTPVTLTLTNGLYSVLLGDTNAGGMTQPLNSSVFTNADVRLRVWFNDGTHGFEQLTPDQRIVSAGYALVADTANNFLGTISNSQLPGNLATTAYVNAATNDVWTNDAAQLNNASNVLAGQISSATNGLVSSAITNGLASTAYVNAATNGLVSESRHQWLGDDELRPVAKLRDRQPDQRTGDD